VQALGNDARIGGIVFRSAIQDCEEGETAAMTRRSRTRRKAPLAGCLLLLLALFGGAAGAAGIDVTDLSVTLDEGEYLVDATIDYRFPEEAKEALENGVPLVVEVHVELRREGAWFWEEDTVEIRLRNEIRYLALAALYQVTDLQSNARQSFVTPQSAMSALGSVENLPLVRRASLRAGERYVLSVESFLDIESLPLPMRPTAYLTPAWHLSSQRRIWRLEP